MTTMDSTMAPNALALETLSESGKAPKERLSDAGRAQIIVQRVRFDNQSRDSINAKIKGMIDGNAPYNKAKLRAAGQMNRTNVNWLEGKAALSAALVPFYDLFAGSDTYCVVSTKYGNASDSVLWSRIITEEFDAMLKAYDGFDFNMQAMLHDMVAFGKGFLIWYDKKDWRFQHLQQNKVLVPAGTKAFGGLIDICVILESKPVHELWGYIQNRKAAEEMGWDVEAVADAIRNAIPKNPGQYLYDYMAVQQMMKDHDLYESLRSATVQTARILVREFNGKYSDLMVLEQSQSQGTGRGSNGEPPSSKFLFKSIDRFEKFQNVVSTFFFETLDGSWNGANGLGNDIYAPMEAKNRLRCSGVDLAFLRGSIVLQAKNASALQKTSIVQTGFTTLLPEGYEVQQSTIMGDVTSLISANRDLDQMLQANTGIYRSRMEKPEGNPRTAREVELQYQNAAVLGNSAVNRFYLNLDKMYAEVYRRASAKNLTDIDEAQSEALEFQKRCVERGVPIEALRNVKAVKAYRAMGNGSPFMRGQAIAQSYPLYPMLNEEGKQNWLDDAIAAAGGQTTVERWNPRMEHGLPNDQQAESVIENAVIKVGSPVMWTPLQNNVIHAQIHLQAGATALASLQQGSNPMEVLQFLQGLGQHTAIHIQEIAKDPGRKMQLGPLEQQFQQMAKLTDQLSQKIQQSQEAMKQKQAEMAAAQQKAKAIGEGTDPDTVVKMATAKADMTIKAAKASQQMRQKDAKTAQDMAIKDAKAAMELQSMKTGGEA